MADNDAKALKAAADALTEIDMRYRAASIDDKEDLKPARDAAFDAYSTARLTLLDDGVVATDADVAELERIRGEIATAAQTQALVIGAGRLVAALAKFI
jgi:hypothetical protein